MIHYVAKSIRYPISSLRDENEHYDWFLISPDYIIYELHNIIEGTDHVLSCTLKDPRENFWATFSNVYVTELIVWKPQNISFAKEDLKLNDNLFSSRIIDHFKISFEKETFVRELGFGKTGDKNNDVARFTTLVTC